MGRISAACEFVILDPKSPFLFADTIRENITFGDKNVKETELIRATEEASLYDTIKSFTNGFETIIGEKGVILSGGQKQRIALARAFLQKPSILILDDPISQVDMETGDAIIHTIRSKAEQMTIIIVSHRLSAIRFSDQIIALKEGRILESGTHAALMINDSYYAKTFRLQEIEEKYAH
jgi:ATP-binding cassette subfamily B protein